MHRSGTKKTSTLTRPGGGLWALIFVPADLLRGAGITQASPRKKRKTGAEEVSKNGRAWDDARLFENRHAALKYCCVRFLTGRGKGGGGIEGNSGKKEKERLRTPAATGAREYPRSVYGSWESGFQSSWSITRLLGLGGGRR